MQGNGVYHGATQYILNLQIIESHPKTTELGILEAETYILTNLIDDYDRY